MMFMNPTYRKYRPEDLQTLILLMAQLGYDHSEKTLLDNIVAVREKGGEVFVAKVAGKVRGCVSDIIDVRLAEGVKGEIVSLVPEFIE